MLPSRLALGSRAHGSRALGSLELRPPKPGFRRGSRLGFRLGFRLGSWFAVMALTACTVEGREVMTTFDPSASGTPTSGSSQSGSDTEPSTSTAASGTADTSSGSGTSNPTTDPSSGSSGAPADEQPEDGMYSECASVADCFGLTTCVIVPGTPMGGYCADTGCVNPQIDCDPNPGATSTAPLACVDNGAGAFVCGLDCSLGQTCPTGMACLALGVAAMVCA